MQYLRHYSLETMFFLLKASMEKLRSEGWGQEVLWMTVKGANTSFERHTGNNAEIIAILA